MARELRGSHAIAFGMHERMRQRRMRKCVAVILNHQDDPWDRALMDSIQLMSLDDRFSQKPSFEIYSPDNDPQKMHREVARILTRDQDKFEAVVTSGSWTSLAMMSVQRHWRERVPLIFAGVDDPLSWGLVDAEDYSGNFITGVQSVPPSLDRQIESLSSLRSGIHRVLLLYSHAALDAIDPSALADSGLRSRLVRRMAREGWRVDQVGLAHNSDIKEELSTKIVKSDIVIMLNESAVMMHQDEIALWCTRGSSTLVGLNLLSVIRGAAFGMGVSGSVYGPHVVDALHDILVKKKDPAEVKIAQVHEPEQLWYNPMVLAAQGARVSDYAKKRLDLRSVLSKEVLPESRG